VLKDRTGGLTAVKALLVAALFLGASSCQTGGPAAVGRAAQFLVRNFVVEGPATIRAGPVAFIVRSDGPSMHEFNIARTDLGVNDLPLAADGTVDDQVPHPNFEHIGEVEGIDIGQHKTLAANLKPGRYVLYCNMDGHYQAGMSTELMVLGP
jgi:Sulfocyanin (SoxE) domain